MDLHGGYKVMLETLGADDGEAFRKNILAAEYNYQDFAKKSEFFMITMTSSWIPQVSCVALRGAEAIAMEELCCSSLLFAV